jgi:ectoine hydroxylase-related dioxygenase (phytanoyl-CoA dioxygenase family)
MTGFSLVPQVLSSEHCAQLIATLEASLSTASSLRDAAASLRDGTVFAQRNLLRVPEVAAVAVLPEVLALTENATLPVRAIFFDKLPGANWHVGWHQDRAIAVREKRELPDWGPWSVKAGVVHVLPPAAILEKIVTIRLHLDPCGGDNGPLRVLPGSHLFGILGAQQIRALRAKIPEVVCQAAQGDALVISPLLLHASSPATNPSHRRVLHLEFAPRDLLPDGLAWAF